MSWVAWNVDIFLNVLSFIVWYLSAVSNLQDDAGKQQVHFTTCSMWTSTWMMLNIIGMGVTFFKWCKPPLFGVLHKYDCTKTAICIYYFVWEADVLPTINALLYPDEDLIGCPKRSEWTCNHRPTFWLPSTICFYHNAFHVFSMCSHWPPVCIWVTLHLILWHI